MAGIAVQGAIRLLPDGTVEGWVWSHDRPGQRLVAELLVNDAPVGATEASRFLPDLAERGIGDGHHGFRLSLPADAMAGDATVAIGARERDSGQVFARMVIREGPAPYDAVLDFAAARLNALADGAGALLTAPRVPLQARLRQGFGAMAEQLAARGGGPAVSGELRRLRQAARGVALPRLARPAFTVLLPVAGEAAPAARQVAALAPALAERGGELVLADWSEHPATALLPAAIDNLVGVRAAAEGAALAEAALAARGDAVVLLDGTAVSAAALLALAEAIATAPEAVFLGPPARDAAARVGESLAVASLPAPARLGLRIALPRALLAAAGGVAAEMADGTGLECVELWLRCRLLGAVAIAWQEPAPGAIVAGPAPPRPQAALAALTAFRRRWGKPGPRP